jgi:PAS domain S-box-containing protein
LEADWVRRDGTILSVRESARAVRDELGNVFYYEGTVEDITERKRAEEELRRHRDHLEEIVAKRTHELERSNEVLQAEIAEHKHTEEALRETTNLLETIFEHTHIMVAYLDPQFNFVRVNRAYAEADEREPSFFPGKNHFDLYPNEENEVIFRRVVETGIPYFAYARPFEYAEHPERGISYWDWSLVPIKNQKGIVSGLVFTLANVTALKRAEESLKASEGKLNAMLQSIGDHMSMMDRDLNIIWANGKAMNIFGDDTVGRKCYEVYHRRNEPCEPHPCITLKVFQDGKVHEHDTQVVDKDGNIRYFHCSANVALRDSEGKPTAVLEVSRDITDQKLIEQALRESESSYRAVVENAAEGIVVVQGKTLQFVNPAVLSMTGCSEKELLTRPFIEFVHPDHRELAMGIHIKRLKGEEVPPTYELKVLDKKGNTVWVENNGILIEWRDKPATLNFLRDVTERKKAEQAIWASESEKRSILNAISDHIIFHDTDLTIRWCNEASARSVGMTQRELVGCHCYELWQGRSAPCEGCPVLRSIETVSYNAGIMTTPDGKWWEIVGEPVLDRGGQIRGAIEISRDITERKKTEQTLRESEERLKILFESAPDTIYVIDSENRFVDFNKVALELVGFTRDEVIGKSLAELGLLSAQQLSKAKANLKKAAAGKPTGPNQYTLKRKDGSHVSIEVRTFPVKIGGKILTLGIARDITEHKQTEKKLLEHQAKLKSLASQLSLTEERERHRLATDLHDQISQSLVISKIKLDQLRKSSDSDEFNEPLKDISNCLGRVIDDTRALTFDLSYPILYELGFEAAVAEWLTDQIQEKHRIKTEFEDDGLPKPLDDDICVLLFRNVRELLINVVKHSQANKVRISIRKVNDNIEIEVEDDGIGFDPHEVTTMATKRAEFGLFSIRERLEQLGGTIEIDSEIGCGSKITMRAPLKYNDSTDRVSK